MGSLSHWELIMAQGQQANGDKFRELFSIFYTIIVFWVYSLELSQSGSSNEYTQHAISW